MMEKYDTSQLTEFPRFEAEATQSGVSTFFNKLWKLPLFTPSEGGETPQIKSSEDEKNDVAATTNQSKQDNESIKPEVGAYAHEMEVRSLPNVVRRITSLIALGSGGGTKYSDTELARYWMPDDISRECYECAARFSTLRRRHHCRVCGQIFCSRCCSQRVPGHIFGCAGGLRVCNYCCNVVLSYLRENVDLNGEISPDLRSLQENLQVKFPDNKEQTSKTDSFMFGRDLEERSEVRCSPKETLQDVFRQLSYTLPTQQHRYRLVRYNGVWRGEDILQWIMNNTYNKTRVQANMICQNLLNAGYMECVSELPHFADYALYRPITVHREDEDDDDEPEDHSRLVESVSSYCLDLNLGESSARLIKTPKAETKSSSSEEEQPVVQPVEVTEVTRTRPECAALACWGEEHLRLLMRQLLARAALAPAWLPALYPLCVRAVDITQPDASSNDIDIRNYVQVKKIPGGTPKDSCLINGVVLTKNVAHRGMPQQISNPSILLLDGSIAYQRVEGKLTSLEPVLMQEHEYLVRCAARITALQARVVLVGGTAGRAVQNALVRAGAALALRVRPRALRRTARATSADLLASIDARIGMPRLGSCDNFYVKSFGNKTLMVLEGCAEPQLGCCIVIRGGSTPELIRLKKIVKFMLLACYNWKLEKAFLTDIEAVLPEAGMTSDEDSHNVFSSEKCVKDSSAIFGTSADTDIFDSKELTKDSDKYDNASDKKDESGVNEAKSISKNSENDDSVFKIDKNNTDNEKSETIDKNDADNNQESKVHKSSSKDNSTSKVEKSDVVESKLEVKDIDDPLQRPKSYTRKTENLSCGVPIKDFSDPLRSNLSVDDDVFLPMEEAKLQADAQNDRWCADDVVLSMSPSVLIPAPYLETESGRRCPLRACYPAPLLRPPAASPPLPLTPRLVRRQTPMSPILPSRTQEFHPFVKMCIKAPADETAQRAALASYRATGCRLTDKHKPSCPQYNPSVICKLPVEPAPDSKPSSEDSLDPFAPENHQQLNVLFYSFSAKSPNVPDFCDNPWIETMEMYGRHDISLGAFLEKCCFNADYKCNRNSCHVPMNQHVRRFVHGDVCITITCNTIGHSNVDKVKEDTSNQVMFWWRCEQCGWLGRGVRLSARALRLSLAQYLRMRGARRPHAHAPLHAFQCRLTTAVLRFSKITTNDIVLPPAVISTNHDTKQMRDSLISQLNDIMLKGHETFSSVCGDAERECLSFKQHMEQLHIALTAPSLRSTSIEEVVRSLWSISDGIITGEKMLRDAQEKWSSPLTKVKQQVDTVEEKSDLDESSGEASNSEGTTYVFASDNPTKDSEKEHAGIEEDEEKGDKKTIRQILSQLLSSNQSANQAGMILCGGLVPVLVQDTQTGAVIAAALASATYRRARTLQRSQTDEDTEASKDKSDGDKTKAAKSNEHVEVLLKDGLVCRVYYAAQFQSLRHAVIAPLGKDHECCCDDEKKLCSIEEGFIRSLAHCVPWATRGGKSGSTFCKTKDDRYVLKEMTKPEWHQFLEFAPHYFNYVASCRQTKLPSLLARILGVFSVGGAGDGVLVLENVWYDCPTHSRFDLKGSSRHRLAPATPDTAASVLLDENLLHLRWERPLYVRSAAARVLWASLERDCTFLATHGVMDYSLLLALGENDLRLGVIDYIRTFTWDKKLEHLVKKNLGGGQPTVVSPHQYKLRFMAAARKYFLPCPEPWDQFIQLQT